MDKEVLDKALEESEVEYASESAAIRAAKPIVEEFGTRAEANSFETAKAQSDTEKADEVLVDVIEEIITAAEDVDEDSEEAEHIKDAYCKACKAEKCLREDTVDGDEEEEDEAI